jgi:hypothetical protein
VKEEAKKVQAVERCGNVKRLLDALIHTKFRLIMLNITVKHGQRGSPCLRSCFLLLNKTRMHIWMKKKRRYLQ